MNLGTNLRVSSLARLFPHQNQMPRPTISRNFLAQKRTSASKLIFGAVLALAFAASANAQQPYPGSAYSPSAKPSPYHYASPDVPQADAPPDVQEPPQNSYAQPQAPPQTQPQTQVDQQPQYQPQYAQPQAQPQPQEDQQHQYAQPYASQQPRYAPQYSAPQQPYADQQPSSPQAPPYTQPDQNQQAAPAQALSAEDLEQLLAPIALYPDSLLAQVLAASTYPAQVAVADQWVQQMRAAGYSSPDQIAAGANAQTNWDPSIKALTAFPDVLDLMNHDLEWTSNLGNAYYNQPQDVMQTVQVLRDRAEQAGNLQSTPQEEVQNDQGYVELAPTNPQVVYVPTYNPWDVYGQPIAPYPGFSFCGALGNFFGGLPIQYGLSFALGAFDRMPFGWLAWGFDWLGHSLLFDHAGYYTHSRQVADWGLPRGGPRAYYGRGGNGGMRADQYRANGQNRQDGQYRPDQRENDRREYDQRQAYTQGGNYQRNGLSNNRGPRSISISILCPSRAGIPRAGSAELFQSHAPAELRLSSPDQPESDLPESRPDVRKSDLRKSELFQPGPKTTETRAIAIRAPTTVTLAGQITDTLATDLTDRRSIRPAPAPHIQTRIALHSRTTPADFRIARMKTTATPWRETSARVDSTSSAAANQSPTAASARRPTPTRLRRTLAVDTRTSAAGT